MKLIFVLLAATLVVGLSDGRNAGRNWMLRRLMRLRQDPIYIDEPEPVFTPDPERPIEYAPAPPPPPMNRPIEYSAGPIDEGFEPYYDGEYMTNEEYLAYVYGPLTDVMYDPYLHYDNRAPSLSASDRIVLRRLI